MLSFVFANVHSWGLGLSHMKIRFSRMIGKYTIYFKPWGGKSGQNKIRVV